MKTRCLLLGLLYFTFGGKAQTRESEALIQQVATTFEQVKKLTALNQQLWGKDIYGPILLVDPKTRQVYSNEIDHKKTLQPNGSIFTGTLPKNINIANTAIDWNESKWAMIMLPLPENEQAKIDLIAHELFHLQQPSLGFMSMNPDNNHLNSSKGRIYLRLELEALHKALLAEHTSDMLKHITHALSFRKYRYSQFNKADSTENSLELNEGLAEYTGLVISNRNEQQLKNHLQQSWNNFLNNPSFVRSFAYQTIPLYGYLLSKKRQGWNRDITLNTNITSYLLKQFKIKKMPADIEKISVAYNGQTIIEAETLREEKIKQQINSYTQKFVQNAHFEILFEKMNVSFDPRNIFPLENQGTVYPNIRVTDNWGILTVENGALMSPNWNKITISNPLSIQPNLITGDGWKLELKSGYELVKDTASGNYKLVHTNN